MESTQNLATRGPKQQEAIAESMDRRRVVTPAVDIFESDKEILLVADVPGVGKDDVTLHFEKERLTLEARAGDLVFRREFVAARGLDVDKAEASVTQGVLRLRLPKAKELQSRQIRVQGG